MDEEKLQQIRSHYIGGHFLNFTLLFTLVNDKHYYVNGKFNKANISTQVNAHT